MPLTSSISNTLSVNEACFVLHIVTNKTPKRAPAAVPLTSMHERKAPKGLHYISHVLS